jgi:hypothetical protein
MQPKPSRIVDIPVHTARNRQSRLSQGNHCLFLGNTFGDFFNATDFRPVFSHEGKPDKEPPPRPVDKHMTRELEPFESHLVKR